MKTNGRWQTIPLLRVVVFLITGMLLSGYLSIFIDIRLLFVLCTFSVLTTLLLNRKRIAQSVMLSTTIILLGILRMGMVSEHDHERNMMFSEGISTLREQLLSMYDRYDFNEEERSKVK